MTTTTAAKPDLYTHILRLVDQLQPEDRLQLVAYIVHTVQPLVARPPAAAAEDDEDDEDLAQAAMEALDYARAHPESVMSLDAFEAELDRAEAAGELPD